MIEIPKKIKVRVAKTIGAIYQGGRKFVPGDIIEIPETSFRPDHYERIEVPKAPVKKKAVKAEEPPADETQPEESEEPAAEETEPTSAENIGKPIIVKTEETSKKRNK